MSKSSSPSSSFKAKLLNFDINNIIDPFLPASFLPRLPRPISHFLGYRPTSPSPPDLPPTLITIHSVISVFLALLVISSISTFAPRMKDLHSPILIPSLGASAVLDLSSISNPSSQPRPTILGHTISAVAGVGIARLFDLQGPERELSTRYIEAPMAVAVAVLLMRLSGAVHPPGGATAALAIVTVEARSIGWWLVPLMTLYSTIMVAVACIVNNIGRKWPEFWWTETELPLQRNDLIQGGKIQLDEEKGNN